MHLDVRSWFSFHDGVNAPRQLACAAAELGFKALGLCDTDGIYGLLEFYRSAVREGLRPVLGLALTDPKGDAGRGGTAAHGGTGYDNAAPRSAGRSAVSHVAGNGASHGGGSSRGSKLPAGGNSAARASGATHSPDIYKGDGGRSAVTLLARDNLGYRSLCALASWRQGVHPDPQVNRLDLRRALLELTERCFVVSDHRAVLDALAPRLGPRHVFVRCDPGHHDPGLERQRRQLRLAQQYRLHLAACTDVRFIRPQDQPVHHLLRAIGENTGVQWVRGVRTSKHYLAGPFELNNLYEKHPGALAVAAELAERCEVDFAEGQWGFPDYETPQGRVLSKGQAARALHELCLGYTCLLYTSDAADE